MTGGGGGRLAWRDGDIVMVSLTALAGGIAIVAAWFGAGGTATPSQQSFWLQLAIVGFAVSAVGLSLWLLRGRRAVGERRVALVSLDPGSEPPVTEQPRRGARGVSTSTAPLGLVRAAGMKYVHHADCPLMAGKTVQPASLGDGEPCGMCVR